jgi:hypothetical protein
MLRSAQHDTLLIFLIVTQLSLGEGKGERSANFKQQHRVIVE